MRNSIKSEYLCNSNKNEPIYEPILPPIPPPLPKKPWENEKQFQNINENSEVDTCVKQEDQDHNKRGPAPLQRSPVIDNVALKALSEERKLKAKEESISNDIVEQLSRISLLTQQHISEKEVDHTHPTLDDRDEEVKKPELFAEELHTIRSEGGVLNASDFKNFNKVYKGTNSDEQPIKEFQCDDKPSLTVSTLKNHDKNDTSNINAQAQSKKSSDVNETVTCYENFQQTKVNSSDTYTKITKIKLDSNLVSIDVVATNSSPEKTLNVNETKHDSFDALEAFSSDGKGLAYIDESTENDDFSSQNALMDRLSACNVIEKQLLPSVEEENEPANELDDETALDHAIVDAAGLNERKYPEISVESIQIDNISHHSNLQDPTEDSKTMNE